MTADQIIAHLSLAPHPEGDGTLVGCTVSPGFDFAGFELAAAGFDITD